MSAPAVSSPRGTALSRDAGFVRAVLLLVVVALVAKIAHDQ
ncbi:hypothetical protein [Isoptericola sp. NPDC019482]